MQISLSVFNLFFKYIYIYIYFVVYDGTFFFFLLALYTGKSWLL